MFWCAFSCAGLLAGGGEELLVAMLSRFSRCSVAGNSLSEGELDIVGNVQGLEWWLKGTLADAGRIECGGAGNTLKGEGKTVKRDKPFPCSNQREGQYINRSLVFNAMPTPQNKQVES